MREILWIFVLSFGAAVLEAWAGTAGWMAPLLPCALFYLAAAATDWRRILPAALLAGAVLDIAYGRTLPVTALGILPILLCLARFWRREGNCRTVLIQIVPGAFCGLVQGVLLSALSFQQENQFWRLFAHNLWLTLGLAAQGAVLLPLACLLLDPSARQLTLPPYLNSSFPGRARVHGP